MATNTSLPANTPPIGTNSSNSQQPQATLTSSKTPVTLSSTSHLDPSAYVRGTHTIQIGPNVLIHPRAHLVSIYSPLTINEGCIIAEKSIIGGPIPASSTSASTTADAPSSTIIPPQSSQPSGAQAKPTTIGCAVHIHPNVTINSGVQISDFTVLESNVTIQHGVNIGKHSKICAGVTLSSNVPDWIVVYGINGEHRRRRLKARDAEHSGSADVVENARLRTMNAERESTMAILKKAAARTIASRSKR